MTDITPTGYILLGLILYAGTVTGLLFGAWLKWWPELQELRKEEERLSALVSQQSAVIYARRATDRVQAKPTEESSKHLLYP